MTPGVEELREQLEEGAPAAAAVGFSLVADGFVVRADGSIDGEQS